MDNIILEFKSIHALGQEITLEMAQANASKYEELFNEATMYLDANLSNLNIQILENSQVIKNVQVQVDNKSFDFYSVKLNDVNFIKHASKGLMERTVELVKDINQKSIDSLNEKLTEVDEALKSVKNELQTAQDMVAAKKVAQEAATKFATFITEGQNTLLTQAEAILATLKDKIESNCYLTPLSEDFQNSVLNLKAKIEELEAEKQKLQNAKETLEQQVHEISKKIVVLLENQAQEGKKDLNISHLKQGPKSVHFGDQNQGILLSPNPEKPQKKDISSTKDLLTKSMFKGDEKSKLELAQAKTSKEYIALLTLATEKCTNLDNGGKLQNSVYKQHLRKSVSEFSTENINSDTLNELVKDYLANAYPAVQ